MNANTDTIVDNGSNNNSNSNSNSGASLNKDNLAVLSKEQLVDQLSDSLNKLKEQEEMIKTLKAQLANKSQ